MAKLRVADKLRPLVKSIGAFSEALKFDPSPQQEELFQAVQRGDKRITVRSGQGPGKTAASTIIGLWRLLKAVDSLLVVTAPTMRQCSDVWLTEAKLRLERGPEWLQSMFDITKKKIIVAGRDTWGCTTVTATRPENAQGFHREEDRHGNKIPLTIIGEEASGISRPIIEQFLGTLSNEDTLFLLIGNPNTRDCYFFDTHHGPQAANWTQLVWNAEDAPRVTQEHCDEIAREFGVDSDVYRIRVKGEFPHSDPNCVMTTEDVWLLMQDGGYHQALRFRIGDKPIRAFGLDFARFGGDESVRTTRSGLAVIEYGHWARTEPLDVVSATTRVQRDMSWKNNECWWVVDAGGMGQGILGDLYRSNKRVHEFHFGGRSSVPLEFENKITEAYFHMARLARQLYTEGPYAGAPLPCIPNDPILLRQLTTRQYFTTKKGRLVLETKDEYAKRGFTSPDRADSLCMGFYPKIVANGRVVRVGTGRKAVSGGIQVSGR